MKHLSILVLSLVFFFSNCNKDDNEPKSNPTIPDDLPAMQQDVDTVANVAELLSAVNVANQSGNITILLEDGTYELNQMLYLKKDNVDFRSKSGNRDAVILKGKGTSGGVGFIFNVTGKNFVAANITLGWVSNHGIQIHGEDDADNPFIHNVRFVNTGEQMLKVSYDSSKPDVGSDNGVVQYCLFEYPSGVGPQYYIGGVDAHNAGNWQVRYNTFKNIRSPENALAEHAIHFWSDSENTSVEGNVIINCDRGVGFGLGNRGHIGGIIKNNMIYTSRDVGIGLENASNVKVYNNSLFTQGYTNSIEYRFGNTSASITNNLCTKKIQLRDGASGELITNVVEVESSVFNNPSEGDLHINNNDERIVDVGTVLQEITIDIDKTERPKGAGYDIGAHEAF